MNPLYLLIPIFSTTYQIFIKMASNELQPWLWLALVSEVFAFILWMKVLSTHNLSKAFPLSAVSYILILASGWLLFGEPVMQMQIVGSVLIMAGIWLISTASDRVKHEA